MKPLVFLLALFVNHAGVASQTHFSSGNKQVYLLELYTSEGCSSCPPAENWFSELQRHPQLWKTLVPVVFHVNYWDYLGWKDPFSSADNTHRQRQYKQQGGIASVYTPGFVLGGREWRGWFSGRSLNLPDKSAENLSVLVNNDQLEASYNGAVVGDSLELHVALLGFDLNTQVRAGENRGRSLTHQFVVLEQLKQTSRSGSWTLTMPASAIDVDNTALAVWVTKPDRLLPLQATGGWLP